MVSRTARVGIDMLCMYARGACPTRAATGVYEESRLSGIDPAVGVVSRWMDPAVASSIVAKLGEAQASPVSFFLPILRATPSAEQGCTL
jgi:hypothetical protein